jgi:hypothetical protein
LAVLAFESKEWQYFVLVVRRLKEHSNILAMNKICANFIAPHRILFKRLVRIGVDNEFFILLFADWTFLIKMKKSQSQMTDTANIIVLARRLPARRQAAVTHQTVLVIIRGSGKFGFSKQGRWCNMCHVLCNGVG